MLSDNRIIELLNSRFVPVWESIRPVPKVTIDFGDGRTLKRTLTGNTLFSVLLPDGRMVDAFPGVYTPSDLLSELQVTLAFLDKQRACGPMAPPLEEVAEWHRAQADVAARKELMQITLSKRFVESPLLAALGIRPRFPKPGEQPGKEQPLIEDPKAALEQVSRRIVDVSHQPATAERIRQEHARLPEEKRPSPEKLGQMAVEQDSRTNVRLLRPAVHLFFAAEGALPMARPARDAIFRRLLQVPVDDPDFGLSDGLPPGTLRSTGSR